MSFPLRVIQKAYAIDERQAKPQTQLNHLSTDDEMPVNIASASNKKFSVEGQSNLLVSSVFVSVLQEIGRRCDSKIEFKFTNGNTKELPHLVEVLFSSERIGTGMGRTPKEAQSQAAENALRNLERDFVSFIEPLTGGMGTEINKNVRGNENGFLKENCNSQDNSDKKEN